MAIGQFITGFGVCYAMQIFLQISAKVHETDFVTGEYNIDNLPFHT